MKYSAVILLFAAAVFWSSASARPRHNSAQDDFIVAFTRWAIEETKNLPEPHQTRLTNKLHEAQHKHWDNIGEYLTYTQSIVVKTVQEAGIDFSRRKREIDSGSDESFEIDMDELVNSEAYYRVYAAVVTDMAPSAHQATLAKMYEKALEEEYEDFADFKEKADDIFEEVTGLDLKKVEAEIYYDEEKRSDLVQTAASEWVNIFQEAENE